MGEEEDEKRGGHMIRGQKADKRKQHYKHPTSTRVYVRAKQELCAR